MNSPTYQRERDFAIAAVAEAARLCHAVGAEISPDVLAKKDRSPVTVADFGAQALICRSLANAFPDDPLIAEEDSAELREPGNASILNEVVRRVRDTLGSSVNAETEVDSALVCQWIDRGSASEYRSRFWTLDPIDGTKGFLRSEQFAVALALVVDGKVVVAALACPNLPDQLQTEGSLTSGTLAPNSSTGTVFYAVQGEGAFVLAADSGSGTLSTSPTAIRVSSVDDPARCRFCESVESGHSAQGDAAAIAEHLGIIAPGLRIDSQAKYAVVARGNADVYLRLPTSTSYREKIWDHAAGTLIVTEAGGLVTDISGKPLEFHHGRELSQNRGVIVTNGRLHSAVLDAVRNVVAGAS
jgi:3'(2'), 5'-bisphosphate nucleotidase